MSTLATVVLVLALYTIGMWRTALVYAHRARADQEERYPNLSVTSSDVNFIAMGAFLAGALWPAYWVGRFLTGRLHAHTAPTERQLRDERDSLQRRIAELERETGIDRR